MSYRSYVPWTKGGASAASYTGGGGSNYTGAGAKNTETPTSNATSQYDSGYSRSRLGSASSSGTSSTPTGRSGGGTSSTPTGRSGGGTSSTPTSRSGGGTSSTPTGRSGGGTSSTPTGRSGGGTTPTYKSTYTTPSSSTTSYTRDRSSTRDGPVKYTGSSSSSFKEGDRLSLRDKYATGTYPGRSRDSSLSSYDRKDSDYSTRGLVRRRSSASRDPSPEVSSDLKTNYVSTLSPYRLYGRSSYSRSTSRDAGGDTASSASSTPATTPVHVPSSLRFTTGTRYSGSSSVRSPVSDKSPSVYGRSYSRSSSQQDHDTTSRRKDDKISCAGSTDVHKKPSSSHVDKNSKDDDEEVTQTTFVTVVTRGTSPTPPSTSSFLRSRRAEMSRSIEKTIARPTVKPDMVDKEMQSDRGDDTTRTSRFSSRLSSSPWSSYLDRYSSNYAPVSRYSSRYGNYNSPSSAKSTDRDSSNTGQLQSNDSSEGANSKTTGNSATKENISGPPQINSENFAKSVVSQKVSEAMKGNNMSQNFKPSSDVENLKQSLKVIAEKSTLGTNTASHSSPVNSHSNSTVSGKSYETVSLNPSLTNLNASSNMLKKSSSDCNSQIVCNNLVPKTASNNAISTASPITPSSSKTWAKQGSPESSSRKLLPPPIPKGDTHAENQDQVLKPSLSLHALNKLGIPNKDFRKSALNVELTNVLQAEAFKKLQEQQRKVGKNENNKQSNSVSSGESESLLVTGESVSSLTTSVNSTNKLRESKSLSKLQSNKNTNQLKPNLVLTGKGDKSKSSSTRITSEVHSSSSSESTSSDETSSESSSSSSSESSTSDEEADNNGNVRRRRRTSPSQKTTENKVGINTAVSSKPMISASSADETSAATEKPPRPPSSPRFPAKTEEAKSFLMRALAPVTNLFKGKSQDNLDKNSNENLTESGGKMGSNQSLNRSLGSDQEELPGNKNSLSGSPKTGKSKLKCSKSKSKLLESEDNDSNTEKHRKSKFKLRKQESGERAWWLQSNPNIPEGIQRIASNISLNKIPDSENKVSEESDSKKTINFKLRKQESGEIPWWLDANGDIPEGIQRIKSSHSMAKLNEDKCKPDMTSNKEEEIKKYKLRHQKSGDKAWWLKSNCDVPEGIMKLQSNKSLSDFLQNELKAKVQKVVKDKSSTDESSEESATEGEKRKVTEENSYHVPKFPLALPTNSIAGSLSTVHADEDTGRRSPYDNLQEQKRSGERTARSRAVSKVRPKNLPLFIGNHTNIDDILGSAATLVNPLIGLSKLRRGKGAHMEEEDFDDEDDDDLEEVSPSQVRIHDGNARPSSVQHRGDAAEEATRRSSAGMIKLDDTALQLYKDGDYGSYLDLEASINEQQEEFEGFQANRKNSIVLRTQLSVRVHTIIEKLLNSEGRELRRALFSLKQIFQEDKDLVHEFVQNDGLACLIKVGCEADQNYQNYILRALGQVMLYVDGMNGVMEHNETVQWLYTLIASKFRLVVKTALKLLLVFVEYVESNCLLLIKAVHTVDMAHGKLPWSNIMRLLKDYDAADTELLIYAMTLVNKTLNGIPDQDTYYDQVDALEEQGIEGTIQRYMSKQGTDLDLLRQFQIYEAVLHHEDGEEKGTPLRQLDDTIRKTLRHRKALMDSTERRKSRRHSTGTAPVSNPTRLNHNEDGDSSSSRSSPGLEDSLGVQLNGSYKDNKAEDAGVTPALRRRRERAERQRSFIREQQETAATLKASLNSADNQTEEGNQRLCQRLANGKHEDNESRSNKLNRVSSRKDLTPLMNAVNKLDSESDAKSADTNGMFKKPWMLSMMYGKSIEDSEAPEDDQTFDNERDDSSERKKLLQLKRENTVKDLTQKLASQNGLGGATDDGNKVTGRIGDMTGLISKAKEGLEKSKSKADVQKSPTGENVPKFEVKKSETELHWEELVKTMKRPLSLCDLDFTDLRSDDEVDILSPTHITNGIPPPPPPVPIVRGGAAPPPPPPSGRMNSVVPPPMPTMVNGSASIYSANLRHQRTFGTEPVSPTKTSPNSQNIKKTKKTVKLFWKEVRDDPIILAKLQNSGMIWDELSPVIVDTQKLEHLFESRAKDLITKEKQQELNKSKELIVLDHKRSNAINIGMTKLPPPRSIKTAILKMDATIMNREGIEKLLTMLPTEEERSKIQEAQMTNPDVPLGSAEQFLLTLASISELPARLKLWAFKLDFENSEKEIAEPLMDLKQGMEMLRNNTTFRGILSTLLSIGVFLNGSEVKGFQIEYLAKVPEVKDTVHKHSLLHHLCNMVMEKFPESTDLYSEIGAITRASKVDFDELAANIAKLEQECKASWDHLKVIAKHDISIAMKNKMSEFLADCAERIIVLDIVHRRVMNRFHKLLLWLGIPMHRVHDMKPNELCRIISEFSLEYRTTRERVLQQLEKKANHRERNKTRGKMITEVGKFRTKEDRADAELRQLLGSDISDAESIHGTWRRQRKDIGRTVLSPLARDEGVNGHLTDGDDEILESLVKTATKAPATRTTPRERKRTRHADRKSLRRTLKNGLTDEEKKHLAAYIKGY